MDPIQSETLTRLSAPFRDALSAGHYAESLLWIFVAGLITALTPCVYPLIGITVSVFGARQAESRWRAIALSSAFVLGIAAFMTPLGVMSALTGFAFGGLMAHPATLIVLAVLCVLMAISLFGGFEISLPASIQTRLAQIGGQGVRGAFLMGLVSGVIAAPCTGPVLAVLLTWIATTQNIVFGAVALFVYSLGLGTLFWIVGSFAMLLPKSGKWLVVVKIVLGIVMLAVAAFITKPLWQDFLPKPAQHETSDALNTSPVWRSDLAQARALAASQHLPLIIDFGADWCAACEELEKFTFSDPNVSRELQRFVLARVDLSTGKATEAAWQELKNYNQHGLPFVVLHRADGSEAQRITGFVSAKEFLSILRTVH